MGFFRKKKDEDEVFEEDDEMEYDVQQRKDRKTKKPTKKVSKRVNKKKKLPADEEDYEDEDEADEEEVDDEDEADEEEEPAKKKVKQQPTQPKVQLITFENAVLQELQVVHSNMAFLNDELAKIKRLIRKL